MLSSSSYSAHVSVVCYRFSTRKPFKSHVCRADLPLTLQQMQQARVMCLRIGCSIQCSLGSMHYDGSGVSYLTYLSCMPSPRRAPNRTTPNEEDLSVSPSTVNYANDIPILHCQSMMMTQERHPTPPRLGNTLWALPSLHPRNLVTDHQQLVPWMSGCLSELDQNGVLEHAQHSQGYGCTLERVQTKSLHPCEDLQGCKLSSRSLL